MWIEKRKDKYLVVERYTDYITGKQKRVSVMIDRDTQQARNKAEKILAAKIATAVQKTSQPDQITLDDLKTAYLNYQRKTIKESTVHRNEIELNIIVKIIGSDALCSRLTTIMIMDKLLSTNKSNTTLNNYLIRLKALLRWGYRNDYCSNLADKLQALPDKTEREKIEHKFLEKNELKILLQGLKVEQWKNLTELLVLSGLRIGEAIALEYDDLDIGHRMIHVTKTYSQNIKKVTSPKTRESIRDVYMQDELLKLCRKILAKARKKALEYGYQSNLVFCNEEGYMIHYYSYEKYLKEKSQAILGRPITSHVMRHTMTSLFAETGVDLSVISRRLGHHDSKITKDIYLHCTQAQRDKDNKAVRNISLLS